MSSFINANLVESDPEDDDYIPPVNSANSDSDEELPPSKRARAQSPESQKVDEAEKKRARELLWAQFQASVTQPASDSPHTPDESPKKMVKIQKRFRFAGKEEIQIVEVPEDSPDAKKWPLWPSPAESGPLATDPAPEDLAPVPTTDPIVAPEKKRPRPGPRKPKISLPALPTSSTRKAQKLSTLDKSAMDWRAHVQSVGDGQAALKDELEANRRGGGYLEKVDFLKRVEERKEEAIEASKAARGRRR